ncbi:MAG: alpha/beta hydrolase [Bacteroidetes bacterium]|nr:alpha/beta hydrolase [Bacteroidota bacterium]
MKKATVLVAIFSLLALAVNAQNKFIGSWEGAIKTTKTIRLIFHIKEDAGKLSATMDSPDQGVTGIACKAVNINGDSVTIDMSGIGIMYKGRMTTDTTIVGVWKQGGMGIPIDFMKTANPAELYRPQTPKPPFNYVSEDVIYPNKDKSIQYGATITMPKGKGPFPAVLLITGSGQQNRDEEIFGHKPFAVIADYLTRNGYAVLRVDDRGMGQTTGELKNVTTADFAQDAEVSLDYLRSRKEVDKKKVGLMGHSEGGMIAEMLASKRKDIDFIVLLAAPGINIKDMMKDQAGAVLASSGVDSSIVSQYRNLYGSMEDAALASKDAADMKEKMTLAVKTWKLSASQDAIKTVGISTAEDEADYVNQMQAAVSGAWFSYFLRFDPQPYLRSLSCKVLALNGDRDIQVPARTDLEGIRQSLAKSKTKVYEVKELKGLNHLFQQCTACTVKEYAALTETMSPTALRTIGEWLDANVKP